MLAGNVLSLAVFLGTSILLVLVFALFSRDGRLRARVRALGGADRPAPRGGGLGDFARSKLPAVGSALLPGDEEGRTRLHHRLAQAGFYDRHTLPIFLGVKAVLMLLGIAGVGVLGLLGWIPPAQAFSYGLFAGGVGMVLPGLWLDACRRKRQRILRRALPDAVDMLVLCVEGGLSINAGLQRVTTELQAAHPLLGAEMDIAQREQMMGLSTGQALKRLGDRADLEEVRTLAALLLQSERYGASVVKGLRLYADTLRQQRQQRAEELAQKASVKILFPTLLCIFPAIFIVILGPAAFQIWAVFAKMMNR